MMVCLADEEAREGSHPQCIGVSRRRCEGEAHHLLGQDGL